MPQHGTCTGGLQAAGLLQCNHGTLLIIGAHCVVLSLQARGALAGLWSARSSRQQSGAQSAVMLAALGFPMGKCEVLYPCTLT